MVYFPEDSEQYVSWRKVITYSGIGVAHASDLSRGRDG